MVAAARRNDNGRYDPVTDPVPRVLVYRAGGWRPAAHPLIKHNKVSFSLPIPFAREYLELLGDPEVKVGLATSAYGGKQIGFFVKGNAMYPGGLSHLKESGTFKGVLWHQGESNTTGVDRYVSFKPCLLGIVRDIRSDLDLPGLPFITGQLTRMASNTMPQRDHFGSESCGTITRVLADIGDHIDNAAHVRSSNCGLCVEHTRHLVDEEGNPTGRTMRMPNDTVHFNRSGLTTMGRRYARAILDYPSFKNNPVRLLAVPGREIDASLVREVSDLSKDKLTFTGEELPDWLTVKPDGSISGTPPAVGEYKGRLTVTDKSGWVDKSDLVVHVQEGAPPVFKADAFRRSPVIAGLEFNSGVRYGFHKTWSSELFEPNNDTLTFSKVDGPDWLTVSPDGVFSGVPAPVTAKGGAKLSKLAEGNYKDTPKAGFQELDFEYDGTGDVLLVFSASVKPEDLDKIETVKLSRSQKRKRQRETGGVYPPAFKEHGVELDDFSITRVLKR